jgi:hypothetical protein
VTYFIVGECVVLIGLLAVPAGSKSDMPMAGAVSACVASVLLWPLVVMAWVRGML